jgi:hypothetical protein
MVERVKDWLADGIDVRIFTARISDDPDNLQLEAIYDWCINVFGKSLPATCTKDYKMDELWDDRVVTIERNTGRQLSPSTRNLDQYNKNIIYRKHRGSFAESMETSRFFTSFADLEQTLINEGQISSICYYGFDDRLGVDTFSVTTDDHRILGFCWREI